MELNLEQAISAIGHEDTAKLLSIILDFPINTNRISIKMKKGEAALIFRVKKRLEEGVVLNLETLKKIPYDLGILIKIE
ncbi:MAG: STIV orfB116 family protein [Promethearchaeia archaeon]